MVPTMEAIVRWLVFFIPCVLGLFSLIAVWSLLTRGVGRWWWAALAGCMVVGVALGAWFTLFFADQADPNMRCIGFPIAWKFLFRIPDGAGGEWTEWKRTAAFRHLEHAAIFVYLSISRMGRQFAVAVDAQDANRLLAVQLGLAATNGAPILIAVDAAGSVPAPSGRMK